MRVLSILKIFNICIQRSFVWRIGLPTSVLLPMPMFHFSIKIKVCCGPRVGVSICSLIEYKWSLMESILSDYDGLVCGGCVCHKKGTLVYFFWSIKPVNIIRTVIISRDTFDQEYNKKWLPFSGHNGLVHWPLPTPLFYTS